MSQRQKTPNDVLQMFAAGILLIVVFDTMLRFNFHEMKECVATKPIDACIVWQLNPINQ